MCRRRRWFPRMCEAAATRVWPKATSTMPSRLAGRHKFHGKVKGAQRLIDPIGFGARGFAHEAGIADARSVLQREVYSAIKVNRGTAFSTNIDWAFIHRLCPILPHNAQRVLVLPSGSRFPGRR